MSGAVVESRRFRTWDHTEAPDERRRWLLIAEAQFQRYWRTWYFWVLVALTVMLSISTLIGGFSMMDWSDGGIDPEALVFGLMPNLAGIAVLALLLLCAPTIADDLRFAAPLFYFSRPMQAKDYLIGKYVFVVAVLLILLMPPVIIGTLVSVGTWGADGPDPPEPPPNGSDRFAQERYQRDLANHPEELRRWQERHMDHFGDWLYTWSMIWMGVIASSFFLGAVALLLSSLTQRGWHAGMAIVVTFAAALAIGLPLGLVIAGEDSTLTGVFSMTIWPAIVTMLPIEAYYNDRPWLDDAPMTIILTYAAMALATAGALLWTRSRIRNTEGGL